MNRTGSNVLASTINGVTGENNITNVWYDHYYKLLNSTVNTSNQPCVESIMNDIVHSQSIFFRFSALDVKHAINKLKMSKSAVTDSMQGEYFKYAHSNITGLLSMLFNAIFLRNYLPCKFMETIIVSIKRTKRVLLQTKIGTGLLPLLVLFPRSWS